MRLDAHHAYTGCNNKMSALHPARLTSIDDAASLGQQIGSPLRPW